MNEIQEIKCSSCNEIIIYAKSKEIGDPTMITFHCSCGQIVKNKFIGIPSLAQTSTHYFEYIEETEYKCLKKN